ncbi:MAG: enoyl-CoA hydratase/isomerase family protein [Chloroflexi bacterium]|nr:enoyl-CoA hydratase/isomerase family protein [Chloroflexota bacterium]
MAGLFQEYKFQYHVPLTQWIRYEGRVYHDTLYEKEGAIVRLMLNRPDKRNAFDDPQWEDLMAGLHQAADDPEVRVIIIKGNGKCFSAGHDLSSPQGAETTPIDPKLAPTIRDYYNIERRRCGKMDDIFHYPKVTIAQVHGYCIGLGEAVATSCDLVIAAEDAIFGRRGFGRQTLGSNSWNGSWPGGSHRARPRGPVPELTGREAADRAIISRAVPLDQLDQTVSAVAERIAAMPQDVLQITKEFINAALTANGFDFAWRCHYEGHIAYQFPHFRPEEINFYKTRRDKGLTGYLRTREDVSMKEK